MPLPLPHRAEPSTRLLFWGPTLIWASTWHVILYQLAEVPAINAVAWRFALASAVLFAIAAHRGEAWRLPLRLQPWLVLMGSVQFGLNYWGVYESERHIPSGLVAVLFSLMVFGNAATGALFFGQPITRRFALSAVVGVAAVMGSRVSSGNGGAESRRTAWPGKVRSRNKSRRRLRVQRLGVKSRNRLSARTTND